MRPLVPGRSSADESCCRFLILFKCVSILHKSYVLCDKWSNKESLFVIICFADICTNQKIAK